MARSECSDVSIQRARAGPAPATKVFIHFYTGSLLYLCVRVRLLLYCVLGKLRLHNELERDWKGEVYTRDLVLFENSSFFLQNQQLFFHHPNLDSSYCWVLYRKWEGLGRSSYVLLSWEKKCYKFIFHTTLISTVIISYRWSEG